MKLVTFLNNRKRIDYLEIRNEGYLIVRGKVESAGRQYNARFYGAGIR